MIVWFLLALFFAWCFSPVGCVLLVLSGVLMFFAVHGKDIKKEQTKTRRKNTKEFKIYRDQNIY